MPTHIEIDASKYHLVKNSVVLLEQVRTIDKQRLKDFICHVDNKLMSQIENALRVSLELHN